MLEVGDVLRQSAHCGHDKCPRQLCGGHGLAYAFCHCNPTFRTGSYINVTADLAGLRDELETGKFLHQLTGDLGALPHEHDDVSVFEADGQLAQPLDGVGVDLGGVRVEPGCAVELADCVLVVVENHNVHPDIVPWPRRSFHTGPPPGTGKDGAFGDGVLATSTSAVHSDQAASSIYKAVNGSLGGACGLTVKGQLPRGGRWLGMLDGRRGLSVPADPLLRPGSVSSGWGRGAGRSAADGSLKVWSQWVRVRRVPESAEKVVKAIPM